MRAITFLPSRLFHLVTGVSLMPLRPTKFLRRRNTAAEHFTQSLDKLARMLRRLLLQYALGAVNGEGLPNLQSS